MNATVAAEVSTVHGRPGYEGANIRTWIGFKHFAYLVEAAVMQWYRERGMGPGRLFHEHGAGLSIVDSSMLLPAVLELDDEVVAQVTETGTGRFAVLLRAERDAGVTVCRAKVRAALVRERSTPALPPELAALVDDGAMAGGELDLPPGVDPLDRLREADRNTFGYSWRVPYYYCHYSDRLGYDGQIRAMEEVVDRFLAARGISVGRMLDERGWIPVVSRCRLTLLGAAHLEETVVTTFTVEDVIGGVMYDGRMDCHAVRGDRLVHVATGRILHGYAVALGPEAGQLARLDPAVLAALTGGAR